MTGTRRWPPTWLWLFPPVYAVHLLDERFSGVGTARWASTHTGIAFDDTAWLAVNVPSFLLLTAVTAWVARGRWPEWVAVALATHLALHGLARVVGSAVFASLAPGVLTGAALCVPLAVRVYRWGARALDRKRFAWGLAAGTASFQPLLHAALLPFLPG